MPGVSLSSNLQEGQFNMMTGQCDPIPKYDFGPDLSSLTSAMVSKKYM
jgi:hypothetical protein